MSMSKLVEALQIFLKYGDPDYPTHCEHDVLMVCIDPEKVRKKDKERLDKLGFIPGTGDEEGCFISFKYGSA